MAVKVADQAWIAAASLERDFPEHVDFSIQEIKGRAKELFADSSGRIQPGVWQHIVSHNVAQKPATPNRRRFFTQTDRGRRRLYRPGDKVHPQRHDAKTHPDRDALPEQFRDLVDWYERKYGEQARREASRTRGDSSPAAFLAFVGMIPAYDLKIMSDRIEQDCERIEHEDKHEGAA